MKRPGFMTGVVLVGVGWLLPQLAGIINQASPGHGPLLVAMCALGVVLVPVGGYIAVKAVQREERD